MCRQACALSACKRRLLMDPRRTRTEPAPLAEAAPMALAAAAPGVEDVNYVLWEGQKVAEA